MGTNIISFETVFGKSKEQTLKEAERIKQIANEMEILAKELSTYGVELKVEASFKNMILNKDN